MKIKINSRTMFIFPTGIIANRFSAVFISKMLKKRGIRLTNKQIMRSIKEIKRFKRKHSDWNLIEIYDKDGEKIEVKV